MSRKNEIQVGITVLVALLILVVSLAWLKEFSLSRGKNTWIVEFPETGGLAESDEAQVNGIRKGTVKSMKLAGEKVRVELILDSDVVITSDSRVAVRSVGLMGEKVVAVDLRTSGRPYGPGDVIPGVYEKDLGQMMGELGETVTAVKGLSRNLEDVAGLLSPSGKLAHTIENFHSTSEELQLVVSENRARVREAMQNVASATRTAKTLTTDREEQVGQAMDQFASAAERMGPLVARLDSLSTVLNSMAQRVEQGEGTIGKLVRDDKLYAELNDSVQSIKSLIQDVKAHPRKYFKFSVF